MYVEEKFRNRAKIYVDPTILSVNKFSHFQPKSVKSAKIIFFYSTPCKVKTASTVTTTTTTATNNNNNNNNNKLY